MVGLAVFAPLALALGVLIEAVIFALLRWRKRPSTAIAGAFWLYVGTLIVAIALFTHRLLCQAALDRTSASVLNLPTNKTCREALVVIDRSRAH